MRLSRAALLTTTTLGALGLAALPLLILDHPFAAAIAVIAAPPEPATRQVTAAGDLDLRRASASATPVAPADRKSTRLNSSH